jgi:formamidase
MHLMAPVCRSHHTGRNRLDQVVAIRRNDWARSSECACGQAKGAIKEKVAAEGARTVPLREHGGNCDIKDPSRGSNIYFPAYVKGGGLSMGDLHFSQGDGEITFCGAIEMAGWHHPTVDIIKDGVAKYEIKHPIFKPSPIVPTYNDYLILEGISVDEQGKQYLSRCPHRLSPSLP